MRAAIAAVVVLGTLLPGGDCFLPIHSNHVDKTFSTFSTPSALFGKKKKGGGGGGGGKPRGQQQQQEKQSVKDARFDAATRQFMFTLVGLSKVLPDKSKKILDNINLSFYPGAKIGIVGLNGSGKVSSVFLTRGNNLGHDD